MCKFKLCQISLVVIQPKQLRKMVQQTFQQYAALKEDDCMVKFFETLKDFVSYDEEVFPCELVVSSNRVHRDDTEQQSASSLHRCSIILQTFISQQQGWSLSVELVIGGRGIRQRTQKNAAVSMVEG